MKPLTPADILSRSAYEQSRPDFRRRMLVEKARRRVLLGPHCTVHFESRETMRYQVHEMLRAESSWDRPGAVEDELRAYNALIPGTGELSATLMLEYESAEERAVALPKFVGLEQCVTLRIGDTTSLVASFDRGQIDERGVSSVQYVKWTLDEDRRALLKVEGTVIRLAFDHPYYRAKAILGEDTRQAIADDPD
jgi:hypothetical protein